VTMALGVLKDMKISKARREMFEGIPIGRAGVEMQPHGIGETQDQPPADQE